MLVDHWRPDREMYEGGSSTVTFGYGPYPPTWRIPSALLHDDSKYFQDQPSRAYHQIENFTSYKDFSLYVQWLYSRSFKELELCPQMGLCNLNPWCCPHIPEGLVRLWILGRKLRSYCFRNYVMERLYYLLTPHEMEEQYRSSRKGVQAVDLRNSMMVNGLGHVFVLSPRIIYAAFRECKSMQKLHSFLIDVCAERWHDVHGFLQLRNSEDELNDNWKALFATFDKFRDGLLLGVSGNRNCDKVEPLERYFDDMGDDDYANTDEDEVQDESNHSVAENEVEDNDDDENNDTMAE